MHRILCTHDSLPGRHSAATLVYICDTRCLYDEPIGKIKIKPRTFIIPSVAQFLHFSILSLPLFPPRRTHLRHLLFLLIDFHCYFMDPSSRNAELGCPERSRLHRLGCRMLNPPPRFMMLQRQQQHYGPEVEAQTMRTEQHPVSHCSSASNFQTDVRSG